jgi:hypothetical protein
MKNPSWWVRRTRLFFLSAVVVASTTSHTYAAFHLWQLKEFFTNADGSVQFIELFTSFSGQNFLSGHTLTATSDGVMKTYTFPANLGTGAPNTHMLLATAGFGALSGGVTADFVATPLPANFFDPLASSISFNFAGFDIVSMSGIPSSGILSLTDMTLGGTPTLVSGVNSPTNSAGTIGSVNLTSLPGDFDHDGDVDGRDFLVWQRNTSVGDLAEWQGSYGAPLVAAVAAVPEPSCWLLLLLAAMPRIARRSQSRRTLVNEQLQFVEDSPFNTLP